jgi:phage gpG-like protein
MISSITLEAPHLERLLREFPERAKKAIQISLQQSALIVQNAAKVNSPYLTGNLRRSITNEVKENQATIGTDVVYARIQELGGVILPKTKKYLRFMTRDKNWVTVGKVIIPPFRGKGYLRPALQDNAEKILKNFADNIEKQLTK